MFPCRKCDALAKHSHLTTTMRRTSNTCRHFMVDFIFKHRVWRLSCRPPQRKAWEKVATPNSEKCPKECPFTTKAANYIPSVYSNQSGVELNQSQKKIIVCRFDVVHLIVRRMWRFSGKAIQPIIALLCGSVNFRYFKNHRAIHEYAKNLWDYLVTNPVSIIVINLKYISDSD